jgi:hypothetical protein
VVTSGRKNGMESVLTGFTISGGCVTTYVYNEFGRVRRTVSHLHGHIVAAVAVDGFLSPLQTTARCRGIGQR